MNGPAFVSYAREDTDFVLGLTGELRARGLSIWLDADIPAGTDWDSSIDEHLRTCAAVLIVLSPASVSSREVRGELRAALNLAKPIVPVLLRSCDMPRQLQTIQYIDLTETNDVVSRAAIGVALQSASQADAAGPHPPARRAGRDMRNRQDLLDDVRNEAAARLAQSLRTRSLNLLKELQPGQVSPPWDREVKIHAHPKSLLGADVGIVQVFDDVTVGGQLLVLGAPGSGKTTAMLEIGQELVRRADRNPQEPIPVFCSLSSWPEHEPALAGWLVDQLKVKYGVRQDHGSAWLLDRLLVPLLDGLDEVAPERQESCLRAINRFQQEVGPQYMVVCCRLAEYENYTNKLQLRGAVQLLPLTDDQVRQYLLEASAPALWQSVSTDPDAIDLARSPLLLGLITVAYTETSKEAWQRLTSVSARQSYLFEAFVQRVLSEGSPPTPFPRAHVVKWLGWLAATMTARGRPELLIEHLQPTWLSSMPQRLAYGLIAFVTSAATVAAAVSLIEWLSGRIPKGAVGSSLATVTATTWGLREWQQHDWVSITVIGLVAGLVVAARNSIRPIETLSWSWANGWQGLTTGLRQMAVAGLNYASYAGLVGGLLAGIAVLRTQRELDRLTPALSGFSLAGYIEAAVVLVALTVAILVSTRPRMWLVSHARTPPRGPVADAVMTGVLFTLGSWPNLGLALAAMAGLGLGLIVRLTGGVPVLSAGRFADALVVGLVSGFGCGAIAWSLESGTMAFMQFVATWMIAGVGTAATAALVLGLIGHLRRSRPSPRLPPARASRLLRSLVVASIVVVLAGLAVGLARHAGGLWLVGGLELMAARLGAGWSVAVLLALLVATLAGGAGLVTGAFVGALFGVLQGLTGPDIERRTVPNQGIRQSAINVGVFAIAGIVIVGLPYGLMNLTIAAVWTRGIPTVLDAVNLALVPALCFGLMGALVPGVAVLQHFTLRFVLWCFGLAPWQYVRFLNYATERMLIQRVGGRYRFIHELLRDHFAALRSSTTIEKG